MKTLVFILLFVSNVGIASGNYYYMSVGAGNNTSIFGSSIPWEDGGGVGGSLGLGLKIDLGDDMWADCGWRHFSQWDVGPPMNNIDESTLDHLGCALEWQWN